MAMAIVSSFIIRVVAGAEVLGGWWLVVLPLLPLFCRCPKINFVYLCICGALCK